MISLQFDRSSSEGYWVFISRPRHQKYWVRVLWTAWKSVSHLAIGPNSYMHLFEPRMIICSVAGCPPCGRPREVQLGECWFLYISPGRLSKVDMIRGMIVDGACLQTKPATTSSKILFYKMMLTTSTLAQFQTNFSDALASSGLI